MHSDNEFPLKRTSSFPSCSLVQISILPIHEKRQATLEVVGVNSPHCSDFLKITPSALSVCGVTNAVLQSICVSLVYEM
jgi:hypothetical protein